MKIKVINISNKRRSRKSTSLLKEFINLAICALDLEDHIDEVRIRFTKDFYNYFPKGKPLAGFDKLYSNRICKIDLTKHWDTSLKANKEAIIHELTHIRQLIDKRLVLGKDRKTVIWNGKVNNDWRKYNEAKFEKMSSKKSFELFYKYMPWEKEVYNNIRKFVK